MGFWEEQKDSIHAKRYGVSKEKAAMERQHSEMMRKLDGLNRHSPRTYHGIDTDHQDVRYRQSSPSWSPVSRVIYLVGFFVCGAIGVVVSYPMADLAHSGQHEPGAYILLSLVAWAYLGAAAING